MVANIPKAAFLIESMVPLDLSKIARTRAKGRDWFVRAGASGGDGSKDKPFKDPYPGPRKMRGRRLHPRHRRRLRRQPPRRALDRGYARYHHARRIRPRISPPAIRGKIPSLLYCPADFKSTRNGYTLQGDGDHTGFVLDGFVFDKKLDNKYNDKGDLLVEESDKSEHLWLARPDCVVRNCVFINGATGAVRMAAGQTIENCIFLNHYGKTVSIEAGFTPTVPLIFRNNTVAFAWEERFGQGHGIMADLLILETGVHAIIDNNIFEFADQHAIRLAADPKDVELTNNVFAPQSFRRGLPHQR